MLGVLKLSLGHLISLLLELTLKPLYLFTLLLLREGLRGSLFLCELVFKHASRWAQEPEGELTPDLAKVCTLRRQATSDTGKGLIRVEV